MRWLSWQACWVESNGTWVRIPGPPICFVIFFHSCSSTNSSIWTTMDFRSPDARWPPGQIWWLGMRIYHKAWSMHTRGIWKVKSGLNVNGPQIASFTSRLGPTPPPWLFLFFLYFIYLIVFVLLFLLFKLTN